MDNGTLVFIIALEAIVIVWLSSKLRQYQKFDKLLEDDRLSTQKSNSQKQDSNIEPGASSSASNSSASVASDARDERSGSDAPSVDLLDMPGVDPEDNIEEAKRVQLVMARCRYAEFYLEQLDDDYERGQFQQIVSDCISTAKNISDPFFRSSALQPIIVLLDKAEWHDQRDALLADVSDDLIRTKIESVLANTSDDA
ncbi:MAG: hypothetical protein AB8B63_20185 [Granulosicoccus sp.]